MWSRDKILPRTAANPFYMRLNQILEKAGSVEAALSAILRRRDRMPGLSHPAGTPHLRLSGAPRAASADDKDPRYNVPSSVGY